MDMHDYPAGTAVNVTETRTCDIHTYVLQEGGHVATVDGKTKDGPWANMCDACYRTHGVGLGIGLGQRLIVVAS